MNQEIKMKWVKALRSGKYMQGRGVLRDEHNRFCCLGVLCAVLEIPASLKEISFGRICYTYEDEALVLSEKNLNFVGLDYCTQRVLAAMNDGGGSHGEIKPKSFDEIADYIEANL